MNFNELNEALPPIFKTSLTPYLVGPNGIGKTEFMRQFASTHGFDGIIELRLGVMADVGDLKGIPYKENVNGSMVFKFARPDWLPLQGKYIVFLDEVNRARHELQQGIFELIREKRIGEHKLPAGSVVVAAGNPNSDGFHTIELEDDAYRDRFAFLNITPSIDEWVNYNLDTGVPIGYLGFFKSNPQFLEIGGKGGVDYSTIKPSRRSVSDLAPIYKEFKEQRLSKGVFREVAHGIIGVESTEAFLSDLEKEKITGQEIVESFSQVEHKVKDFVAANRTDVLSAVSDNVVAYLSSVTEKVSKERINNILSFINLIPVDLAVALMSQLADGNAAISRYICNDVDFCLNLLKRAPNNYNTQDLEEIIPLISKAVEELYAENDAKKLKSSEAQQKE